MMVLKSSLFSYFSIWSLNPETEKGQVVVLGFLEHNLLAQQGVDKWLPKNSELFGNGSEEDQTSIPVQVMAPEHLSVYYNVLYYDKEWWGLFVYAQFRALHQGILNKYNKLVIGSTFVVCDLFFLRNIFSKCEMNGLNEFREQPILLQSLWAHTESFHQVCKPATPSPQTYKRENQEKPWSALLSMGAVCCARKRLY